MFDLRHTLDLIEDEAFDEAVPALRQVIAQMPAYVPAYVLLAQAYEAMERWPEALEVWQRAHFFAPNSPTVQAGLMRVLDEHDIVPTETADEFAPDVEASDAMDRMADELLQTIQEEDSAAPSSTPVPPIEESESPSEGGSSEPAADDADDTATNADVSNPPVTGEAPREVTPESLLDDEADTFASDALESEPTDTETEEPSEAEEESPPQEPPAQNESTEAPSSGNDAAPEHVPSPLEELADRLPDPDQPLPEEIEDLDRLIDELESARIDPQPELEDAPTPDLDNDIEDMVSETLARIYISQKQYEEAARVYLRLASQEPDRAKEYMEKASDMRSLARDQRDQEDES